MPFIRILWHFYELHDKRNEVDNVRESALNPRGEEEAGVRRHNEALTFDNRLWQRIRH